MQIPFCGASYLGRSKAIDPSRSINLYPEIAESPGAKTQMSMVGTPGTLEFVDFTTGAVRLEYNYNGRLFVVVGANINEVFADGSYVTRGTLPDISGYISAADNGTDPEAKVGYGQQILMITNHAGYIFRVDTYTVTEVDFGFENPSQVEYLDGYFIVTCDDSRTFHVSELYNGLVWPGLAFAQVIATSDNNQTVKTLHQQLYFFKEASIEIWYDGGVPTTQGSPFIKLQGTVIDYGTPAYKTVAKGANTLIFLANTRNADFAEFAGVCILEGYQAKVISTPALNYRMSQYTLSDAFAYVYNDEGHTFYVLTFPTDDVTLVYDLTTQMWHERSTSVPESIGEGYHRHLSNLYTYAFNKHLVADYRSSKIMSMSSEYYDDNGDEIVAVRIAQPIFDRQNLNDMVVHRLVLDMETGVGDNTVTHNGDPQAWLSWSNDGGYTWSSEYAASVGKVGEYGRRLSWRCLGRARNRVFKLRLPDKVKKVILGAYVNDGVV